MAVSYICLSSEGSGAIHTNNTSTSFANTLPEPLLNKEAKKFFIKIISISMPYNVAFNSGNPTEANINLYELEPQQMGRKYTQCAGTFKFPPEKIIDLNYASYTFKHSPYLRLRFSQLQELHVKITDRSGKIIQLRSGPPTLIWLELKKDMEENEFTIHCSSLQPDTCPGNTFNRFTSPLSNEIDLSNYEVALLNLQYPPNMEEEEEATLTVGNHRFIYPLFLFRNTGQFIESVKIDLKNSGYNLRFSRIKKGINQGRYSIRRLVTGEFQAPINIDPSPLFTRACGQTLEPRERTSLAAGKMIVFKGIPNIHLAKANPMAALHCDIIQSNIIGGLKGQVLQIVPITKNAKESNLYEPEHLSYHQVNNFPINKITFTFLEPDGRIRHLKTKNPNDEIRITLTFRIKKK